MTTAGLRSFLILLASVALVSCSGPGNTDGNLKDTVFEKARMMELAYGSSRMHLSGLPFDGAKVALGPILLDEDASVEFKVLVRGEVPEGSRIALKIVIEGKETVLNPNLPVMNLSQGSGTDIKTILGGLVRLDLSRYRNKRVILSWVKENLPSPLASMIVRLKLVPNQAAGEQRPNILFICSDAHRYDHALGPEGASMMPWLQGLAGFGTAYHRAYASASWTLPSITSVCTGLAPRYHITGRRKKSGTLDELETEQVPPGYIVAAWANYGFYRLISTYPDQLVTLAETLQAQGYTTALIASNSYYFSSGLFADGHDIAVNMKIQPGPAVNQAARSVIESQDADRPLFLLVHYMDVHRYLDWTFLKDHPGQDPYKSPAKDVRASYGKAVRDTDRNLSELIGIWKARLGFEDSLIVFYADHGEHLFDPGSPALEDLPDPEDKHARVRAPILNHGNSMQEALLHVPLVVKYPAFVGRLAPQVQEPVGLIDLFPTVLDLLDVEPPGNTLQGVSLLHRAAESSSRMFFADFQFYGDDLSSLRQGPYKLIKNLANPSLSLLDLRLPGGAHGEKGKGVTDRQVQERMEQALERYIEDAQRATQGLSSTLEVDQKKVLESLRALGYVQ